MGLNLENLFVRSADLSALSRTIDEYFGDYGSAALKQPNWPIPSGFRNWFAQEQKRKVVVSSSLDGWVIVVDAKEFVDFGLANALSERLATRAVIAQVSESTGCAGYLVVDSGLVVDWKFSDTEEDPYGFVRGTLNELGIGLGLTPFKEAIRHVRDGWTVKSLDRSRK